jgi:hypothetical protein
MNMREYVLYKVHVALQDRKHEKEDNGETFTTALKMTYKEGRGHFNIFLDRIEKVSDFKKVMQILAESDYKEFDHNADIVKEYLTVAFNTVVSLRKEKEQYGDYESKKAVMNCDTFIKRYKGFADAFNKIFAFDPGKKIILENAPEVPTAKKDSYYIMVFNKIAHKWTLQNIFGFSFVFNGFKVGVHKTPDGKAWDAALVGYGATFGMYEKSKKAAMYYAIDTLKKCNFSPSKMSDTAARFASVAAECNIDISEQIKPPTEPETVVTPTEPPTAAEIPETPTEPPTAAEIPETPTEPPTAAEIPETPTEPPTEPETVATPTEPPTEPETVATPTEPPTEPETVVTPRRAYYFTPVSPGERHAAAITPENAAPPMVVIWLYFAILQKRLFSVSNTLERCHVPVYGFTRLLYAVVSLLLYHASLSGLPLFVVSNFKRDHGDTFPCTLYGFTALRVPYKIETVSGLTRLTGCRTCYHDTS